MKREVNHIPGRFFITLDTNAEALLEYSTEKNTMILQSTYTPEKYRGMRLAEQMTKKAVEYAKQHGMKIRPLCSYAITFFQKHPEYEDALEAERK